MAAQPTAASNVRAMCAGDGVDSTAIGVLSTLVFSAGVGLLVWLLFAILRPRFRQLYALREWFVPSDHRPPPLHATFWAFLFPPVPLVPQLSNDISNYGDSPSGDDQLFPSDDQLSQRTLWIAFLLCLGWTVIGLGGALPLYLVSTPCTGDSAPHARFGGTFSTLQDLSLLRLLKMLDKGNVTTTNDPFGLDRRAIIDGVDEGTKARTRLIILAVLLLVLAVLPALFKLAKEFNRLLAYRRRWVNVRCEGIEMGWLSSENAPGLKGWGESAVKDMLAQSGLSSTLGANAQTPRARRRQRDITPSTSDFDALQSNGTGGHSQYSVAEVDVHGLFTVADTTKLTRLIIARDAVLNHLEHAESQYISSFRLSSPEPTISSFNDENDQQPQRPRISRPHALGTFNPRRGHGRISLTAPTAYMAPSPYYRLRGPRGVSGGNWGGRVSSTPSLTESFGQRVIGSRFQEVNRNSNAFEQLPPGTRVRVDRNGELDLAQGPNHGEPAPIDRDSFRPEDPSWSLLEVDEEEYEEEDAQSPQSRTTSVRRASFLSKLGLGLPPRDSRVDSRLPVLSELGEYSGNQPRAGPSTSTTAVASSQPNMLQRQGTFPMRATPGLPTLATPPHMRIQHQQPYVRPLSTVQSDDLGSIYGDIRMWRSRLKILNAEIAGEQQATFEDIAQGTHIKGWMVIGRGLRFLPGVQLIEGRSKDDIRWEELQHDGGVLSNFSFWIIVCVVGIILALALVPVLGLVLSTAPNFAHYLPFLKTFTRHNNIATGIATSLAPAIAATLFICIAIGVVHYAAHLSGSVSISRTRMVALKATFFILTVIGGAFIIAMSAVLFSLDAFDTGDNKAPTVADGSIYIAAFLLVLALNAAVIGPGLLMLQPVRLWRLLKSQRRATTPRQRFRATYPRPYNPSFAMGASILGVFFAATVSLLFPLIGPPIVLLLFLTLVAHRYLVGYVYGRTNGGSTGGLLQLWMVRRFATMLSLQPLLLGLVVLSRRQWTLGGILVGAAALIVIFVETFAAIRMREPGVKSLSPITRESIDRFSVTVTRANGDLSEKSSTASQSPEPSARRTRSSMASVLDMISFTLAIPPSGARARGPVPLATESIDDLVSTERAVATHPDAPPQLPFIDRAEETADLLYPPELLVHPPVIWLASDAAGVARSEAHDLQRYHDLSATLDVSTIRHPLDSNISQYPPDTSRTRILDQPF